MCVVETSTAGREYKVRDMAQADFGYARRRRRDATRCDAMFARDFCALAAATIARGDGSATREDDGRREKTIEENSDDRIERARCALDGRRGRWTREWMIIPMSIEIYP